MRVAAYTGGPKVPSARARVRQYIEPLRHLDVDVHEYPMPWGNVLPARRSLRPAWMGATAAARALALTHSWSSDTTWISRQLLPAFAPLHALAKGPLVLDVDDAVWLNTGGHRAGQLARACAAVVCGNQFLAEYFSKYNSEIYVVPTAVDTRLFSSRVATADEESAPVMGWIGTSGNFPFLYGIEEAIAEVLRERRQARLLVVADRAPRFSTLGAEQVEFVQWTPQSEAESVRRMSIGLMPLVEDAWCAGKCSYKMLCYMACGVPVVVSPAGMNREVLAKEPVGFAADSVQGWAEALLLLIDDVSLRQRMGAAGRLVVEQHYSLERLATAYARIFKTVTGTSREALPLTAV